MSKVSCKQQENAIGAALRMAQHVTQKSVARCNACTVALGMLGSGENGTERFE